VRGRDSQDSFHAVVTLSKTATGKYFAACLFEDDETRFQRV
jgi:hypothetical protein